MCSQVSMWRFNRGRSAALKRIAGKVNLAPTCLFEGIWKRGWKDLSLPCPFVLFALNLAFNLIQMTWLKASVVSKPKWSLVRSCTSAPVGAARPAFSKTTFRHIFILGNKINKLGTPRLTFRGTRGEVCLKWMPTVDCVWTVVGWSCQAAPENTTHHRAAHTGVLLFFGWTQTERMAKGTAVDLFLRKLTQQRSWNSRSAFKMSATTSKNSLQHVKFFKTWVQNLKSDLIQISRSCQLTSNFYRQISAMGTCIRGVRRSNCSCLVVWEACDALFERTSVLKLLLQEGNLSRAGCFGMLHTTAEIIESDSACNYCWRTLDAGRRPLILLLALDTLTRHNSHCHPNTVAAKPQQWSSWCHH